MPQHVVVDGSNLATEGRSAPSLKQLNEAVMAYIADHPNALITVVVDATFGHRIDSSEVVEFDEAVANNELVAPPAGAVGRGDAFVLSIADKVHATILTNDSYQEFHADYPWLFDEGRMVGGKPVPHIGWVFVNRIPVRGPMSRKVTAEAKRRGRAKPDGTVRIGSPDASLPMPVPKAPPPGPVRAKRGAKAARPSDSIAADTVAAAAADSVAASPAASGGRGRRGKQQAAAAPQAAPAPVATAPAIHTVRHTGVNELLPFLSFVEHHPVGTLVQAVVDHYSSHGAYVKVDDVFCYVPLRLMADPAPRSAREVGMKVGDTVELLVHSLVAGRRSIDLAVPGVGDVQPIEATPAKPAKASKAAKAAAATKPAKQSKAKKTATPVAPVEPIKPVKAAKAAKAAKSTAPKAAKAVPAAPAPKPAKASTTPASVKKTAAKKAVAPTEQPAPAKKAVAKKASPGPAKKATPVAEQKAPAKKAAAKKAAAPADPAPAAPAKRSRAAR
jgi:hypothetical protein